MKWLRDLFSPERDLDTHALVQAFNDSAARSLWISSIFNEIKQMNYDVDKRLLNRTEYGLSDLCARRKAFQDILELALSARRQVTGKAPVVPPDLRHNRKVEIDLDHVTS